MIRLIELSPVASDELEDQLAKRDHAYRRKGTRFMFLRASYRSEMREVSRLLDFTLAKFGQSHLIEDRYV